MLNLQFLFQHLRIGSVGKRGLRSHCAFSDQQLKTVIHRMHVFFIRRVDGSVNLRDLIITDHIPDSRGNRHDLKCRNLRAVQSRNELLRDHRLQYHRKLYGDLPLLIRRKYINDAVNGIGCTDGVKRGKNEMTGLCRSHGDIHRFIITHFAQQNNVRALAEGRTQRIDIAECINTDLTLADDTFVMPVQVFDGILQRDDMLFHRVVDLVDQTQFQITDEPTGMKVTEVTVKVGGTALTPGTDTYSLVSVNNDGSDGDPITLPAAEGQKVRVRFASNYIGENNTHAGQTVTVEVKAQITDAATFANKASSDKGNNTPEVNGKLGSITINKYDENYKADATDNKLLAGAEFSIAPKDGAKIQFVYVGEEGATSVYKKATAEEIDDANIVKVTNIVAKDGVVVAKGLDDGEYEIVEEKAPAGYSVVEVPNVTIANGDNPVATANVADSKLHSLPHTGGMGTTLFTIAGCAIMVAAAGFFFASRKRVNK